MNAAALVLAPVLVVLSVWLYTLVFAFAALWFAHFGLAALQRLRVQAAIVLEPLVPAAPAATAVPSALPAVPLGDTPPAPLPPP